MFYKYLSVFSKFSFFNKLNSFFFNKKIIGCFFVDHGQSEKQLTTKEQQLFQTVCIELKAAIESTVTKNKTTKKVAWFFYFKLEQIAMPYKFISICLFSLIQILYSHTSFGEVYKWTDENGRVVYGDKPKSDNANKIKI